MENQTDRCSVWASPPGETLCDILKNKNVTREAFACSVGESLQSVDRIFSGEQSISHDLASKIGEVTSTPVAFWIRREIQYREKLKEISCIDSDLASVSWLKSLPLRELNEFGWLSESPVIQSKLQDCLDFFDVRGIPEWKHKYSKILSAVAFKKSSAFESSFGSIVSWLRKVEIETEGQACDPWNPEEFRKELYGIRNLTRKKDPVDFLPELQDRCNKCGVSLVILRAPRGCPVSGVSRFDSSKAVIALSFRYLSDDHFWFAFFHEAGHLLLHEKAILRVEGLKTEFDKEEEEANSFAAKILIPSDFEEELMTVPLNHKAIMMLARRIGVSPGVVVGQLQFRKRLTHSQQNSLKRRFSWPEKG